MGKPATFCTGNAVGISHHLVRDTAEFMGGRGDAHLAACLTLLGNYY